MAGADSSRNGRRDRKHGQVGFYLAQALSGHGCVNAYLKRSMKRDDESFVQNAEHTLFFCARWGAEREVVGRAVGAQLTPDTMFSVLLQSEHIWMLIESFVTLVMKTRELDGHAERGNNGGQWNLHQGLHPRSCVFGGRGCPRRSGEESLYSSPGRRG